MFMIQTPQEFLADFVKEAEKAKKRIYLQSMLFERGQLLQTLEPVLIKKAKAGVDVQITTDWVSKRYFEDNANVIPPLSKQIRLHGQKIHVETEALISRWEQAGIVFTFTNKPTALSSFISINGRNHTKMYLIDDKAAWIGGINLFDIALTLIDFMVKSTDPLLIDNLAKQFVRVNNNKPKNNLYVQYSPLNKLLIDAGIRGKSIIYDEAATLISNAKQKITFASQFLPDGKILQNILQAAKRGVAITIITSNSNNKVFHKFPYNIPYLYLQKQLKDKKNITVIHRTKRVHAKLLITDEKIALFGSHNLTRIGVLLATEEIAIRTADKKLVTALQHFINSTQA